MALRPVVFDMNHADAYENGKDVADFEAAYAAGYRGVVHKVSEGEHMVDPLYAARRFRAIKAGMLWGGYHFMRPGDAGGQVSTFLSAADKAQNGNVTARVSCYTPPASLADERSFVRLALDFEDARIGLAPAEHFLDLVHMTTKQPPWLYSGFLVRELLEKRGTGAELAPYQLWLAEYSTVAKIPRMWKNFVMWQRSGDGEGPGPHDIPGIGRKQDVDYFDGTDDQLRAAWYGAPQVTA